MKTQTTQGNIADLIKMLAENNEEIYSVPAIVRSVNVPDRTCDVELIDGKADIPGVKIQASISKSKGIFIKPKVDSEVIITFVNKDAAYVALYTEIDEVLVDVDQFTFNGGGNGGLINIESLITKVNLIEADLNIVKAIFAGWAPITELPLKTLLAPWSGKPLVITLKETIEDTKVKH